MSHHHRDHHAAAAGHRAEKQEGEGDNGEFGLQRYETVELKLLEKNCRRWKVVPGRGGGVREWRSTSVDDINRT